MAHALLGEGENTLIDRGPLEVFAPSLLERRANRRIADL
jgi:hypothetical protein